MNYKAQKQFRLFYFGDVNIEHGGFFYSLEGMKYDYADFVRVVPCVDAGGADNVFWIERGNVNILNPSALKDALRYCGMTDEYEDATPAQRRHMAIHACMSYGNIDIDQTETVRVGPECPFSGQRDTPKHDKQLRANASLRNYVRNIALKGF